MRLLIVTGMSGSGKSKALAALEDNGYYCLDNLPTKLLPEFIDMILQLDNFPQKVCATIDVRNHDISTDALDALDRISKLVEVRVIFLDCEESVLLKRYKETRRLHPLMLTDDKLDLQSAIKEERFLLENVRQRADFVIDTSLFSAAELRMKLLESLPECEQAPMQLNFTAFGYKYGIPSDCDLVFDVRCLPNPFYVDELRGKTGADREVRDFVMASEDSRNLYSRITSYLDVTLPLYRREGKAQLVVGLGCTGGQHRSLTFALLLADEYAKKGYSTHAFSRDSSRRK